MTDEQTKKMDKARVLQVLANAALSNSILVEIRIVVMEHPGMSLTSRHRMEIEVKTEGLAIEHLPDELRQAFGAVITETPA